MPDLFQDILTKIESRKPMHAKKLRKNLLHISKDQAQRANAFYERYLSFLNSLDKDLDYGIECYLKMNADMIYEHVRFVQTGHYAFSSFEEAHAQVYNNPDIMEYYMHGLLLSQFLWRHHHEMFAFFIRCMSKYKNHNNIKNYLEVGGGHGLFISEAMQLLGSHTEFDLVDISQRSLDVAQALIANNKVNYVLSDIFKFQNSKEYDFITMGEVLEHVENPKELLVKLWGHLKSNGYLFLTVPANGPAIDHIYLFRNAQEIRDMIFSAQFEIVDEVSIYAEDVSPEKAEALKVTLMYGALLKKVD